MSEQLLLTIRFPAVPKLVFFASEDKPPLRYSICAIGCCLYFLLITRPLVLTFVRALRVFWMAKVVALLRVPQTFLVPLTGIRLLGTWLWLLERAIEVGLELANLWPGGTCMPMTHFLGWPIVWVLLPSRMLRACWLNTSASLNAIASAVNETHWHETTHTSHTDGPTCSGQRPTCSLRRSCWCWYPGGHNR